MIQQARQASSNSLLRELEYALVLVKDDEARGHFLRKLSQVAKIRDENTGTKTGAKDAKSEILTYLHQRGFTQTANIWARALELEDEKLKKLLKILQERLMAQEIEGILEIHLQDREVNSPHIQFVGNNAPKAEMLIAQTLVELKYETSLENALNKKDFRPYFELNPKASHPKHNDITQELSIRSNIKEARITSDSIDNLINEFTNQFSRLKTKISLTTPTASTFRDKMADFRQKREKETNLRHQRYLHRQKRRRRLRG